MSAKQINKELTKFKAKWPGDVGERGFAAVPRCLITCAGELGLKPLEALVLNNVIDKCWEAGDKAWFRVEYLAENVGRGKSAIKEATRGLQEKGFIIKERRNNTSSLYDPRPTNQKLAEHLLVCRRWARNSDKVSQKSSSSDSPKPGSYIETELNINQTLETFLNQNSHGSKNGADDHSQKNINGFSVCPETEGKHNWEEFTVEKPDKSGEQATHHYIKCEFCGLQFHKKGEPPFQI